MADANESPPIAVNPSPLNDQIASGIRNLLLAVGVVTAIAGFVAKRDLAGFIVYVQSSEFIQVAGLVLTFGSVAWSQWKTRHRAKQLASVAAHPAVPDAVAHLK